MAVPSSPDWQERVRSMHQHLANYRNQHDHLRRALEEAGSPPTPPTPMPTPMPTPTEPTPPAEPGQDQPQEPVWPSPPPGWKERCRQSILNGEPQARIQRLKALCALTSSHMEQVESSLEAASRFVTTVAERMRDPAGVSPQLVNEVISSQEFQRLCAGALADLLRERAEMAHSRINAILCTEPGEAPRLGAYRKGVPVLKTEGVFWWWIIIIIIVVFFLFFLFPLDQPNQ